MSLDYLAKLHPHERDSRILFDEPTHVYTIDGDSNYTSVTTWNHSHFEKFDSDKVIDNMMKSKNWHNNKYFEYDRETIKKIWDDRRDIAAKEGTKMHYDIECYYNNCENTNDSDEYIYFKNFLKDFSNLKPYRTEWTVFHEELKLAGSIDMIFENDDGTLQIYDWKRSKDIVKTNNWNKYSINENINHLPDTNYWHYCLQLNTYKAILELKYNKKVTDLYLVCLHPDKKNYERIKVVNLENEIVELFNERKNFLN